MKKFALIELTKLYTLGSVLLAINFITRDMDEYHENKRQIKEKIRYARSLLKRK